MIMNRIKKVLEQKGIKQTWLAKKLGKSYNMVNAYAQNRQQPRLETLMDIAEILDVDVKELIISNKEQHQYAHTPLDRKRQDGEPPPRGALPSIGT
jgi:transcriptional regulator with XRE-family HTH domain